MDNYTCNYNKFHLTEQNLLYYYRDQAGGRRKTAVANTWQVLEVWLEYKIDVFLSKWASYTGFGSAGVAGGILVSVCAKSQNQVQLAGVSS